MVHIPKLPRSPGCYLFMDSGSRVIYVGKAKALDKRVASYFSRSVQDLKTQALVKEIASVDFVVTENEVEALLLENTLIKKHQPKYNIDLKDSKRYAYIHFTDEELPRMEVARKKSEKGQYFGPFVSGMSRAAIMDVLNRKFFIRTRKWGRLKLGDNEKKRYLENVRQASMVLKGKTKQLAKELTKSMEAASRREDYEYAMKLRDRISALKWLGERQLVESMRRYNEDILHYRVQGDHVYLMIFQVHKGTLVNKQEYEFSYSPGFLDEFIVQYYADRVIPSRILIPHEVDRSVGEYLARVRRGKVTLIIPQKGSRKQLMDLILKNIEARFLGELVRVKDLGKRLGLDREPKVIECFDISHLSGKAMVGSMVSFRNGTPDKKNYRRFKIREVDGVDDTMAMAEIVRRRYYGVLQRGDALPDLIVIDGGKGQLNFANLEIRKLGLRVPVIALAKRLEEVFLPRRREAIRLPVKSEGLRLLQHVRDEAHRFAISYNRLLRKKAVFEENIK